MDTFETLRAIISDKFGMDAAEITPDTLLDTLGVDSLHAFDIIFEAEEKYGIRLSLGTDSPKTIQDFVNLIDEARAGQGR